MKRSLILMGIGAGLMYLFDPELGAVRRDLLKDRLQELLPETGEALHEKVDAVAAKASEITHKADAVAAEKIHSVGEETLETESSQT
jgi:hypothetical protein